jgi:hypothetical protein
LNRSKKREKNEPPSPRDERRALLHEIPRFAHARALGRPELLLGGGGGEPFTREEEAKEDRQGAMVERRGAPDLRPAAALAVEVRSFEQEHAEAERHGGGFCELGREVRVGAERTPLEEDERSDRDREAGREDDGISEQRRRDLEHEASLFSHEAERAVILGRTAIAARPRSAAPARASLRGRGATEAHGELRPLEPCVTREPGDEALE